ncbi:Efflux transport system, outer membrane factor (OMF) lipoprotein [hydrothermal vent metagenome]|uniref:Efflux transport system, outer membrane factor (OMF) lipoprotein n=1 Tax=hydrothermal vent metagenome TaxID=652676 RepID=A0A3B1BH69_9ZZZZ
MKKLLLPLIAVSVMILSSCAVGPDFQKPQVDTLDVYRFDSLRVDSIANLEWWNLFDDSVLDSLVITALRNNKDLLIAVSRIEEARANLGFTKADIYPKLDISAGAARGDYAIGIRLPQLGNNFNVSAPLSWEIDFWGKFRRANESARAQLLASEYSLRTVQLSLISEVVSTYFQLLDYDQRLKIAEETVRSREKSLNIIQQRYDQGIIPEIDINQAEIQKEIAVSAVPFYRRLKVKTENVLNILLGKLPLEIERGKILKEQTIPPDIPPGLPAQLLERRPDIRQAEYLVMAQNAQIGVAEAMRLPAISLTAVLGFASTDLSSLISGGPAWSIGGNLFGPLFNFGKNIRRVEIQEEKTKQALLGYENTVLNAFREVEDALVEVQTYREQAASKKRQVDAARNALSLSRERYDGGITSYLEVLDAERSWFTAELELSDVRRSYLTAYIKLYKALGGGWITKEEKQAEQNNQQSQN